MKNENVDHMDLKGPDGAGAPWKAGKMPLQRGVLEPLSGTIEIPANIGSPNARTYILMDERHQVGRVGYWFHRKKVPVVTVGHDFAIQEGGWASQEEYWGEFLTKPFRFRCSPENPMDSNAIMITSSPRGKFLGFLGVFISLH